MPVNEILAPYYAIVQYATWAARHTVRLYLPSGTVTTVDSDFRHSALEDATYNATGSISHYVYLWFQLVYQNRNLIGPSIEAIAVWQSAPGTNTLLGFSTPIQPTAGSVQGAASSYVMLSGTAVSGPTLQRYKVVFFEATPNASPQRLAGNTLLLPANTAVWDYVLSRIVTQDGLSPVVIRSTNYGYNRKLARRYGRTLQP